MWSLPRFVLFAGEKTTGGDRWEGPIYFLGSIFLCSTCSSTESFEQRLTGLNSFFSKLVQGEAAVDLTVLCTSPACTAYRGTSGTAGCCASPAPSHPPKRKEMIVLLPSFVSMFYAPVLIMYFYLKKGRAWSEGVATLQLKKSYCSLWVVTWTCTPSHSKTRALVHYNS